MVGDAPGDLRAAKANGVLFFPVVPGAEEGSWSAFGAEAVARFFDGTYAGEYEAGLVERFERSLPEAPPWKERT